MPPPVDYAALQEMVRRVLLPAAPPGAARRRRHLLRLPRRRLRQRCSPSSATAATPSSTPTCRSSRRRKDEPYTRAASALPGVPPRPLRRVQPDLRPRHALRPEDGRPHRVDPDVAAAAGALAVRLPPRARHARGGVVRVYLKPRLGRGIGAVEAADRKRASESARLRLISMSLHAKSPSSPVPPPASAGPSPCASPKEGLAVAVNYSRSETDAEETLAAVQKRHGVPAILCKANVADEAAVRAMVAQLREELGGLDVLVNNAGTTHFIDHTDLEAVTERSLGRDLRRQRARARSSACRAALPLLAGARRLDRQRHLGRRACRGTAAHPLRGQQGGPELHDQVAGPALRHRRCASTPSPPGRC